MKIVFEDERFENNYFISKALYRLEAIENISKNEIFEFLRVKFLQLHETVSVNELKNKSLNKNYSKYFDSIGTGLSKRLIIVDIRVEYLYLLSAGSIWKALDSKSIKKVFEPKASEIIEIGVERTKVSQGDVYEALGSSAKFNPLNRNNRLSLLSISDCTVKDEEVTVLIPHSEIIRHYFSASKYFISKLFEEDKITELAELIGSVSDNYDTCSIKLNSRYFLDSDVPFIARALMDKTVLSAMRLIYSRANNALKHSEREGYYHQLKGLPLETNLPFEDKAKLDVIGYYLNIEDSEQKFFLVRKIQTCYHPWPFEKLNIISAETFKNSEEKELKSTVSKEQESVEEDQVELSAGNRPSANETELVIELDQSGRFPFLETLSVQKKRDQDGIEDPIYNVVGIKQVIQIQKDRDLKQGSLGQENHISNNTINPVQITPEKVESKVKSFDEISKIFYEIESENDNWTIIALPPNQIDNTHPYGLFSFEGTKWSQAYDRNRKGLLLRVEIRNGGMLYFLDIEPYKKTRFSLFLFADSKTDMNEITLAHIINNISENSGKGIKSILESKFNIVKTLKHTSSSNKPIENRIIGKVDEIIQQMNENSPDQEE
ncbi:MAG: hypothetical protein WBB40_12085 [Psychrobacter alimentarius]